MNNSSNSILRALFFHTPNSAWYTIILVWIIRFATFSLLLRSYLIPWLLSTLSKHVRIRSVSVWSIRGLYIRAGSRTIRVDRVRYGFTIAKGVRLRLEGLNIDMGRRSQPKPAPFTRGHRRRLTLADFAPSPMARRLWNLTSRLYVVVEPHLRPIIRIGVIAVLRLAIRWIPHIISGASFEAHNTTFTFPDLPGTSVTAESLTLHAGLHFTDLENVIDTSDQTQIPRSARSRHSYGFASWRKRFTASFQRTLDRAWGKAQGKASIRVKFQNIGGSTHPAEKSTGKTVQFLRLPGAIDFGASVGFNPREATADTHSLKVSLDIGDCLLELDTLKLLLKSLKSKEAAPPMSATKDSPGSRLSYFSSMASVGSPTDGIQSPQSSVFSGWTGSPPTSPLMSPASGSIFALSPSSPFFETLSASIRSRRGPTYATCRRLNDFKCTSVLSVLDHASLKISAVTLATHGKWGQDPYEIRIEDIDVSSNLSNNPSKTCASLQRHWLGTGKKLHSYDPDSYAFNFSIRQAFVERRTRLDSMRLLTLDKVDLHALATQWPAPWLQPSPFMCGDPNAPLLAIRGKVGGIEVTERLERLRELVAHMEPSVEPETLQSPHPSLINLPRLIFELECGTLRGRIICADTKGLQPFAVEMRNNGFVISAESSFGAERQMGTRHQVATGSLRMDYKFTVVLDPTLVRVRSRTEMDNRRFTKLRSFDPDFLDDPSILSLESFECRGEGHAVAQESDGVASVFTGSPILDLHISSDAICLELWNPHVISAIHQLISIVPPREDKLPLTPLSKPLLDRLPAGISLAAAVPRFIIFVTSPDINPQCTLELSRGFAFRTGLLVHYSSMHSGHAHRFIDLPQRTQTRHKLDLPQEQIVDAVSSARASAITQNASAHFSICLSGLALRSAVATEYDADNPHIFERDDCHFDKQEFLQIPSIKLHLCLTGKRGAQSKIRDNCEVSLEVPEINATFQLAYVYSMMLAIQGIKSLLPPSPPRGSVDHRPPQFTYRVKAFVSTIQVMCVLRTQRLAIRIDGIDFNAIPDRPLSLQLHKLVVWVRLPPRINNWEEDNPDKWEEFICLQSLHGSLTPSSGTISVDGESGRLRIPFGYVFADFATDLTVTVKAIKHLSHITAHNLYCPMPNPEPEGPKSCPSITVRLRCLCLEAADDSLETKLAVIWRCGQEAIKSRMEREEAFQAKVAAIYQAESEVGPPASVVDQDYQFDAKHSVTIEEARKRLDEVHELDWNLRLKNLREQRSESEDIINQCLRGKHPVKSAGKTRPIPNIVEITPIEPTPPLFRILLNGVFVNVNRPSFPKDNLPGFLHEQGSGMPLHTQYSLLVPLHLNFTLSSLHITLRDYPLPLFSIPPHANSSIAAWKFDTDLVIAEEMGSDHSVNWIDCPIMEADHGIRGAPALSFLVPKTIMPVKTYANPVVHVTTNATTILSWSVSYTPAIQDLMKVMETLSTPPHDPSPGVGFWDKMRLLFHWSLEATFSGEVRFHMKGSRDPYKLADEGAGFVLSWKGDTKWLVAKRNEQRELIQILSDSMLIAIPNLEHIYARNHKPSFAHRIPETSKPFRKVGARLQSGVRFGVGFVLERACGIECTGCSGPAFHRKCRHFDFIPHYKVRLEKKPLVPVIKTSDDSYNGFRSDFIHLSVSLASATSGVGTKPNKEPSSFHLTPKGFAHFWAWCALFDGALSLPTRQGSYYPPRITSPKFGRHLATLKYRLHLRHLFVMHAYIDESRETWVDGVVPWIGVKGLIEELHADMHQRDEESVVPGLLPGTSKVLRRKPVYAAEVSLKGLDLRALLAIFKEPLRQSIEMIAPPQRSNYRAHNDLPSIPYASLWYDTSDFIEIDWSPSTEPRLHLLPVVSCPQFTYFKRNSVVPQNSTLVSKFGLEGSHFCLLGKSLPVPQVQIGIAEKRIHELRKSLKHKRTSSSGGDTHVSVEKMVALLEEYVTHLKGSDNGDDDNDAKSNRSYLMPTPSASPDEWAEFENVYHAHCPKIEMDSTIRDIMMQYYYCSRGRKGLEYHMATRAVKFIRDQAEAALGDDDDDDNDDGDSSEEDRKEWGATATAHMAASALKKILKGDSKPSIEITKGSPKLAEEFDPLKGWSEGVSLRKSHCCLLLKPQIVMREEGSKDALILAAVQAKLQVFAVMDDLNADDPVCGKVMSRSHTSLSGLQTFSPSALVASKDAYVPLEVLIDLRCESKAFDQLVPQTDATFSYDKFNRLRLRNNVTSITRASTNGSSAAHNNHLQNQTDLIQVHIPRFTVSASDDHFQTISHVVTKLLLFSDAAHKTRLEKLETLLFTYDFTDLAAAAKVVAGIQDRLGDAIEAQKTALYNHNWRLEEEEGQLELLKLKAHIFLLSEELNFLFDAIKLAQDRHDDHRDQKSALLLHASSSEISWRMLDDRRDLLSKLVVQNIDFFWLSRQDSSTTNNLSVSNLQAFDGSRYATWAEILSKHDEPANHPLLKRGLFLLANWTVLAPVGGITIYEAFEMSLHPMRLQIDARVGRRIMEYLWPARRDRREIEGTKDTPVPHKPDHRTSLDSPRTLHGPRPHIADTTKGDLSVPPLRKLGNSRSFTDLRESAKDSLAVPTIHKLPSSETLHAAGSEARDKHTGQLTKKNDAAEMKTRTSQKSFVLVKISSMNLLLSIVKEGSFECHDARIRTRDLEYRNQTWSFEELVNQFIPSDTSWRGWVKMAFHQPLLPVLPVARELISKTKWNPSSSKTVTQFDVRGPAPKLPRAKVLSVDDDDRLELVRAKKAKSKSPSRGWGKNARKKSEPEPETITSLPLTDEPESFVQEAVTRPSRSQGRKRMISLFLRSSSNSDPMGSSTTLRPSGEK